MISNFISIIDDRKGSKVLKSRPRIADINSESHVASYVSTSPQVLNSNSALSTECQQPSSSAASLSTQHVLMTLSRLHDLLPYHSLSVATYNGLVSLDTSIFH